MMTCSVMRISCLGRGGGGGDDEFIVEGHGGKDKEAPEFQQKPEGRPIL